MLRRWWASRKARDRLGRAIQIFYDHRYSAKSIESIPNVQAARGARVLASLFGEGLLTSEGIIRPRPVSVRDLLRVHSLKYLEDTAEQRGLGRIFGLRTEETVVEPLLTAARLATGGTLEATRFAIGRRGRIGLNLGGGFHHAHAEKGSGFCVYNDIAVAVRWLRARGFDRPIAIVDLDFHESDGVASILKSESNLALFSIDGSDFGGPRMLGRRILLSEGTGDARYLGCLRTMLPPMLDALKPWLVFYIAGADVLEEDRLGRFNMSVEGMFERDRFVFDQVRARGGSCVMTLGGGYSSRAYLGPVHLARYALCDWAPRSAAKRFDQRFSRIAQSIDPAVLMAESDTLTFSEEDLFGALHRQPASNRVLGFYSVQGVEYALERYGLLAALRRRRFVDLEVQIDPKDPDRQIVRIDARKGSSPRRHRLVELVVRRHRLILSPGKKPLETLYVEWLLLQDPTERFSAARPQLPGQEHPGLGLAKAVTGLLIQAARRLNLEGLVNRPAHFHNAFAARHHFHFVDPQTQGRFLAMLGLLNHEPLAWASAQIEQGHLRNAVGEVVRWEPGEFVCPTGEALQLYLESKDYQKALRSAQIAHAGLEIDK